MLKNVQIIVTIEEHSIQGGLGSIMNNFIIKMELKHLQVLNIGFPDQFIEHGQYSTLMEEYGFSPKSISAKVLKLMQNYSTTV